MGDDGSGSHAGGGDDEEPEPDDGGSAGAGGGGGAGDASAGGFSHKRAHDRLTRLELACELYRLPATVSVGMLCPLDSPPSWPLVLARRIGARAHAAGVDTHSSIGRADALALACLLARLPYGHHASVSVVAGGGGGSGGGGPPPYQPPLLQLPPHVRAGLLAASADCWAPVPCPPGSVALAARTPGGGTIALVVAQLQQPAAAASAHSAAPLPRQFTASLHTDDARVRASLVGDGGALGETLAALSAGTLALRAHSNELPAAAGSELAGDTLGVAALLDWAGRNAAACC
jgi:hypothetical protein